jgi:hypothetical protein
VAKLGDRVKVNIQSPAARTSVGGTLTIEEGGALSIEGKIVGEQDDQWIVELDMSIGGKKYIFVGKDAVR